MSQSPRKTIVVASTNPVKLRGALGGFIAMFPAIAWQARGVSVPSGVAAQPLTSQETLRGALNRARAARALAPDADFCVGIEGGVEFEPAGNLTAAELWTFAWVAVLGGELTGKGRTAMLALPPAVAGLVRQGKELGEADDIVFGRTNSKQESGAVGLLTGDVIDRAAYYTHAVTLALIPFKNEALYPLAGRSPHA